MEDKHRLVIVSNRLPIVLKKDADGKLQLFPGSGGLVTALAPVLKNRGGVWIGWPGIVDDSDQVKNLIHQAKAKAGYAFSPVFLTQEQIELFYYGFSNEVLWPLFHDLQALCRFNPKYWEGYQNVNALFAEVIQKSIRKSDFIWIHDYQLMTLAQELRKKEINLPLGFFLHIPFPSLDTFLKLPWRFQIIRAMLEYDLIGFQTIRDQRNFIHCVRSLLKRDVSIEHRGQIHLCRIGQREVKIGSFPISIDYEEFSNGAAVKTVEEAAWYMHESLKEQKIIFSIDRLDYTKGITYRLEAARCLFKKHPELLKKVTFMQVVIPSRLEIPGYQDLKIEIDRLVGEINSEFTENGWVPIHYMFRSLNRTELLSHYRTSEIGLITPVKDGMNLVSKEYVAANVDRNGVLILSEFAGAASQLREGALLINPYDIEGLAETIYQAITMPKEQRVYRMRKMQRQVKRYNIYWWVQNFLNTAFGRKLIDFPIQEEFIPEEEAPKLPQR